MQNLLTTIKTHLRLDLDSIEEDEYLLMLYASAKDSVIRYLNRDVLESAEELAEAESVWLPLRSPIIMTPAMQAAILMVTADLYENRENTALGLTATTLPTNAWSLIEHYRIPSC